MPVIDESYILTCITGAKPEQEEGGLMVRNSLRFFSDPSRAVDFLKESPVGTQAEVSISGWPSEVRAYKQKLGSTCADAGAKCVEENFRVGTIILERE